MDEIRYEILSNEDFELCLIKELSAFLAHDEADSNSDYSSFWNDWFSNVIPGEKVTIIARDNHKIVGVTRFWSSPFCDQSWFNEGLKVHKNFRKHGIGKRLVQTGLLAFGNREDTDLFANIHKDNNASIQLHKALGFECVGIGSYNSYGEYREHIIRFKLEMKKPNGV